MLEDTKDLVMAGSHIFLFSERGGDGEDVFHSRGDLDVHIL